MLIYCKMVRNILNSMKGFSLETWLMIFCIITGVLFLIAALAGAWRYYFSAAICFSSAVMVSEDKKPKPKMKRRP